VIFTVIFGELSAPILTRVWLAKLHLRPKPTKYGQKRL